MSQIIKCPICGQPYRIYEVYFDCYMDSDYQACPDCRAKVDAPLVKEPNEQGSR